MENLQKAFENSINVVFASDNNYAPYLGVSLCSLIEHCDINKNYDIIILDSEISDQNKKLLSDLTNNKQNISLRFISSEFLYTQEELNKFFCHSYYTKEIYYRIFIPDALNNYDRVIYLDCDTVIKSDLVELFNINLENNVIAGVNDFNNIINYTYFGDVKTYYDKVLKLKNIHNYINSGVLLMDLNKLRKLNLPQKTFELLDKHKELLFPDQDILNLLCEDKIKILDNSWNYISMINLALIQDERFISSAEKWSKGLCNQKIIHYVTEFKPWNSPERYYAKTWWTYAKKTGFYQDLLQAYFKLHPEKV